MNLKRENLKYKVSESSQHKILFALKRQISALFNATKNIDFYSWEDLSKIKFINATTGN